MMLREKTKEINSGSTLRTTGKLMGDKLGLLHLLHNSWMMLVLVIHVTMGTATPILLLTRFVFAEKDIQAVCG
jgi:hypothetical protein